MDFDWEKIGRALATVIPVIILVVVNIFFRKQQEQKKRTDAVRSLLSEIDYNQRLVEAFSRQWQTKNFKTATWKRNKGKMDYIAPGLGYTLSSAYEIIDEFNREIDRARKQKSTSYLAAIRVERLREPLTRSRQGLEEWLQLNKGKENVLKRSRSRLF